MATDPLVPNKTPFNYNVGINYESWENGRTGRNITADLDQITKNFGLIKTFHDAAVGTGNPSNPQIDPTQQEVISYVTKTANVQLAMGTLNSALAQGGFGTAWSAGLMTSPDYTDKWVQMIVTAFGSRQAVVQHLKTILLGNELDMNGPPPPSGGGDPNTFKAYQGWINQSFENLKASLSKAGLGSIPVSTTIANYGSTNAIAVNTTAYIQQHWSSAWNGGNPIVFFNQYTSGPPSAPLSGTDYKPVIDYFESVNTQLGGKVEPFIGETGYSTFYGQANQVAVYNQIFAWLNGQYSNGHKTVPLFAFDAFDQPTQTPAFQKNFGIFAEDSKFKPTGLKPGLVLSPWTATPIVKFRGDFNGDFTSDILVQGTGGEVAVWDVFGSQRQSASVVMQGANVVRPGNGWTIATAAADFNGDGTADILWQTPGGGLALWDMLGSQLLASSPVMQGGNVANPGMHWALAGVADFNGDGKADILWRNDGGAVGIWQMNDTEVQSSAQVMRGNSAANPGNEWSIAGTADFNGDAKADILWRRSTGEVGIWEMDGTQLLSDGQIMQGDKSANPGREWSIAGTGDFNGDGKADVLWRRTTGEVGIWDLDSSQLLGYSQTVQGNSPVNPGTQWSIAGTGDYNGDGMADILWHGLAGQMAIWTMNDAHLQSAAPLSDGSNTVNLGSWQIAPTT